MSPSSLPQKLWRPLGEVKSYIEKMPDGVTIYDLSRKVESFSKLSTKEKRRLIEYLDERESVIVLKIIKPGSNKRITTLRHKKFGYPKNENGNKIVKCLDVKACHKCGMEKPVTDFYVNNSKIDGRQSFCIECTKSSTHDRSWKKGDGYAKRIKEQQTSEESNMSPQTNNPITPESLRKQAEELLKAAEIAEKKRQEKDIFNKALSPIKLELNQAAGKMQRKLDEFIDCMDDMNKALQKLKDLSA
ncbi:hypothetical protein F8538_06175 [Edwardsiella ictaluri]|uniref:hypothetical protein n=1 Tax=Edwardsiella ictaluri TaxID=67780 RepID=UPI0018DCC690|nr:hypothetical protein [Edwardsiella ictaluri]QPW26463.1 hypothetical protein F8538_06175 [Edwardsiella ictaluri]